MTSNYYTEMREKKVKGGKKYKPPGERSRGSLTMKSPAWPGLPGKTQPKDRSNGVTKTGKLGSFHVKKEGI